MPPLLKTGRQRIAALALALAAACAAPTASAQVVSRVESPLRAFDAARQGAPPPHAETVYYVTILPANPDAIKPSVDSLLAMSNLRFPALRFVVSVAPMLFADEADESARKESQVLGALRHLHVRVTTVALDADGRVIETAPGTEPLTTLEIAPSEISYAGSAGNLRNEAGVAAQQLLGAVGPIGSVLKAFQAAFHRSPAPTQIAYLSGPNAFGWRWYQSTDSTIEGLHYAAALFQVAPEVRSLRINVDVTANWHAFGVWTKSYEFIYLVAAG
jgi:hypothetical protein